MELSTDHADPSLGITLLMQATGVTNRDFFDGLVGQSRQCLYDRRGTR